MTNGECRMTNVHFCLSLCATASRRPRGKGFHAPFPYPAFCQLSTADCQLLIKKPERGEVFSDSGSLDTLSYRAPLDTLIVGLLCITSGGLISRGWPGLWRVGARLGCHIADPSGLKKPAILTATQAQKGPVCTLFLATSPVPWYHVGRV